MGTTNFEDVVNLYYPPLYKFALSLTRQESDAYDLTQQTFFIFAEKGHQLHDASKTKSWLFTTLHRQFLEIERRRHRFPHYELETVREELPAIGPDTINRIDSEALLDSLNEVDLLFRGPVALFYLKEHSYLEIAEILEIPVGTVKSRISRGIAQLQHILISRDHIYSSEKGAQ